MKKLFSVLSAIILTISQNLYSQDINVPEVYLLTCGPGTETYSRWGHSALRIVDNINGTDRVYNWGVFDFATPAFAWKFARGRLEYMLGVSTYERFIREYFMEGRWVQSQKINLEPHETEMLLQLIAENLKPENVKYRYDFFYDDCSTRIRDLLENAIGSRMLYPPDMESKPPTFRSLVGKYLKTAPWLRFGVDLLMGSPGNKKATVRDRMFLPIDMQRGLSDVVINRGGKMIPLLRNPETILEDNLAHEINIFYTAPLFIFSVLLIIIIIISGLVRSKCNNRILDIILFSFFSVLAFLMIFFNFFTDHRQMKWNLNIVWLSPFIILCLISLILNRNWYSFFRFVFFLNLIWFLIMFIFPHSYNNAFMPLLLILIVRSSARSDFRWNPLSIEEEN
ncbi:MAG TPA: hypothetical protein DDW27_14655 [Bacteroidales bacterium]|nr:hypothetical protein [Bacteroidales bacterium]